MTRRGSVGAWERGGEGAERPIKAESATERLSEKRRGPVQRSMSNGVIANHAFGVMKRSQVKAVNRDEGDKRD